MAVKDKIKIILLELRQHAPFTLFGALLGLVFMVIFQNIGHQKANILFAIFHPTHVVLSAMVTASLFRLRQKKTHIITVLIVGYVGSIGVATLSDCIIPYIGEHLLDLDIPSHQEVHQLPALAPHFDTQEALNAVPDTPDAHHEDHDSPHDADHHDADRPADLDLHNHNHNHKLDIHLGFIEEWYLVNPAALLGIILAFFIPHTKLPHAGHILISTWASSAHVLMNTTEPFSIMVAGGMFVVLFLAVWLPCCFSDIVFPMLFVKANHPSLHTHP